MTGELAQRIRKLEVRGLKCWFPSSCQVTRKCLKTFTHEIEIHMYIFKEREHQIPVAHDTDPGILLNTRSIYHFSCTLVSEAAFLVPCNKSNIYIAQYIYFFLSCFLHKQCIPTDLCFIIYFGQFHILKTCCYVDQATLEFIFLSVGIIGMN